MPFKGGSVKPPLSYGVEKRQDQRNSRIFLIPPLLNTTTQGGFTVKKTKNTTVSQLRALATRTPSLGRVGQGALELGLPQIRKCHFLSDPCVFGYIF